MNKKIFYLIIFFTAIGICTGTFYQIYISDSAASKLTADLEYILENAGISSVINKTFNAQLSLAAILSSSFIPIFLPAIFLIPVLKGFSYGFSSAMLIELYGLKGILYIMFTLLPFAVTQLIIYSLSGCLVIFMRQTVQRKNALKKYLRRFIIISLILSVILSISCILETFLQVLIL